MDATTKPKSFSEILLTERLVLVDFSAEWCGPCKMMKPVLEELKSWAGDGVRILKVDIDKNIHTASQYHVTAVPTFLFFRHGQAVWRHSGAVDLALLKKIVQENFSP
ncbi:MAG TPA: thioredoxin [Cyclobacteriaceae bacterium]|jgi:thioredoxin 1|nr:thioredoxin [Cyclobacteriaceae bacterium]